MLFYQKHQCVFFLINNFFWHIKIQFYQHFLKMLKIDPKKNHRSSIITFSFSRFFLHENFVFTAIFKTCSKLTLKKKRRSSIHTFHFQHCFSCFFGQSSRFEFIVSVSKFTLLISKYFHIDINDNLDQQSPPLSLMEIFFFSPPLTSMEKECAGTPPVELLPLSCDILRIGLV